MTQGLPFWLGPAEWQQRVLAVLTRFFGPVTGTCGSDQDTLTARVQVLRGLGLTTRVHTWASQYRVDSEWVIGHLGSAVPGGALRPGDPAGPEAAIRAELTRTGDDDLIEESVTTAITARHVVAVS